MMKESLLNCSRKRPSTKKNHQPAFIAGHHHPRGETVLHIFPFSLVPPSSLSSPQNKDWLKTQSERQHVAGNMARSLDAAPTVKKTPVSAAERSADDRLLRWTAALLCGEKREVPLWLPGAGPQRAPSPALLQQTMFWKCASRSFSSDSQQQHNAAPSPRRLLCLRRCVTLTTPHRSTGVEEESQLRIFTQIFTGLLTSTMWSLLFVRL